MRPLLAFGTIFMFVVVMWATYFINEQRQNSGPSVWDLLLSIPEAEWLAKPRGQHREGFSVAQTLAEVARRDRMTLGPAPRRLAITA